MSDQTVEMYDMDFVDYVAVAAMQALIQSKGPGNAAVTAELAYDFAQAMCRERESRS